MTVEMATLSDEEFAPPADLWCIHKRKKPKPGYQAGELRTFFLDSRENVVKAFREADQSQYDNYEMMAYHLEEGFWIPMEYVVELRVAGEGV